MATATKSKLPKLAQPTNGAHEPDDHKIVVRFDPEDIAKWSGRTIRDFESVQPVRFVNLVKVLTSGEVPWDTLLAFMWVTHRQVDPYFTFDDVLDLPSDQWDIEGLGIDKDDPTAEPAATTGS